MVGEYQESVTVHPELVKLGDPVTISVTSGREYLPLTLELTERYLEQEFTVGDGVRVSWTAVLAVFHSPPPRVSIL